MHEHNIIFTNGKVTFAGHNLMRINKWLHLLILNFAQFIHFLINPHSIHIQMNEHYYGTLNAKSMRESQH